MIWLVIGVALLVVVGIVVGASFNNTICNYCNGDDYPCPRCYKERP